MHRLSEHSVQCSKLLKHLIVVYGVHGKNYRPKFFFRPKVFIGTNKSHIIVFTKLLYLFMYEYNIDKCLLMNTVLANLF